MPEIPLVNEILHFWFADTITSPIAAGQRVALWFGQSREFDLAIEQRFGDLPARALNGEFNPWQADPRGALALVIVLDQFPRNLYRGTVQAFAFDAEARKVAAAAVNDEYPEQLNVFEASFLYLPFEHAEDMAQQQQSVAGYRRQFARAADEFKPLIRGFVAAGHEHRQLIEKFGRFPHRNRILGRISTAAEDAYLAEGGKTFGQSAPATSLEGR